jgi:hypothetical protein
LAVEAFLAIGALPKNKAPFYFPEKIDVNIMAGKETVREWLGNTQAKKIRWKA